jgi:anti-anti-sigma regulatory factor
LASVDLHGHRLESRPDAQRIVRSGRRRIVLDLEKVRFIDTSGLGELVA